MIQHIPVHLEDKLLSIPTPYFLYSKNQLFKNLTELSLISIYRNNIHYAMKSNGNSWLLKQVLLFGYGLDVNSKGEALQGISSGFKPEQIIVAGVGKTEDELHYYLANKFKYIKVESIAELQIIGEMSNRYGDVNVSIRINPTLSVNTHPYIQTANKDSKFGITENEIPEIISISKKYSHVHITGLCAHLGSQIQSLAVFVDLYNYLDLIAQKLINHEIKITSIDLGGGFGILYDGSGQSTIGELKEIISKINLLNNDKYHLLIEPGRIISGNTGALITTVNYVKKTDNLSFLIVDAGMTENIRPALYQAKHTIVPYEKNSGEFNLVYDVVGPVCESSDFLGKNVKLPELERGDKVAVLDSGAYTFVMASNYNFRAIPGEYVFDDDHVYCIRKPQSVTDLVLRNEEFYEI